MSCEGLTLIYKDLMSERNVKTVIKPSLFKMRQLPAMYVVSYIEDDLLGKCRRISTVTHVGTPTDSVSVYRCGCELRQRV